MNQYFRKSVAIGGTPKSSPGYPDGACSGHRFSSLLSVVVMIMIGLIVDSIVPGTVRAGTTSLREVLKGVEIHAPALKAAYATADAAAARRHQAIGNLLGELDVYAHDLHFNDNRLTRPISPPIDFSAMTFDKNQIGYGLSARLPIDISGRLLNTFHASSHQTNAARADAAAAHLSLMYEATSLYRELERIEGQREALLKQEEALQKHVEVAEEAVRIGRIATVEELRLVAEVKAVEGRLIGLDGIESGVRSRLAALLDVSSFADSIQVSSNQPDSMPTLSIAPDDRPEVQAAVERSRSGKSAVKAAWGGFLPNLFVTADWQQNQGYDGSGSNDATWQVAIQASLPLWNGTKRIAALHEAQAQSRAAEYYAEAQRRSAQADVAAARGAFEAARAQYAAARSALDAAEEVARIQTDRFNNGRLSAADLVDAEATLAEARSELSTSLVRWWRADDALRRSVGLPPAAYGI